ncbi:MAG TPA: NAD-dependent epimerase/dehydratase family protein [Flavobacteriales bacterium]|nr:NAD-dependent epimerase/dehydratase family protein [Flavobacteriales bacterium]
MIIGSGLIAGRFSQFKHDNLLLFASGVSNSRSNNKNEYNRELELLEKHNVANPAKTLIYFSTYSVVDPSQKDTYYVKHKLAVEEYIKNRKGDYLIVRTSNIVGKTSNPNTITNFLFNHINNQQEFECWQNAERNLLDVDHLVNMCMRLVAHNLINRTVFLVNPISYPVPKIVAQFEKITGKTALCTYVDKGAVFDFDKSVSERLFKDHSVETSNYLEMVIQKYYGKD